MTSPDSPEHRRYLNRVDTARRSVVVAFAVCVIGFSLFQSYVIEHTWLSAYSGLRICLWTMWLCGIGTIACLLALAGFIGESLLRAWNRRHLTHWELVAAVPCGLLACVAPFAVLAFGPMLCDNFAFDSLVGVLAIGIAVCLVSIISFGVFVFVRHGLGRSIAISVRMVALLLGLAGCIMLAVFVPVRTAEARKQHEIVVALKSLGCRVHYDFAIENGGHRVIAKDPDYDGAFLAPLTGSDFRHYVVRVDLQSTDPNVDEVLPHLRGLSGLKYVVLSRELSAGKIRQIEQAVPACEIKYIRNYEERPWPPPPVH